MNWDSPHPADGEPTGPVDPEVFVLSVQHADDRPLALLANFTGWTGNYAREQLFLAEYPPEDSLPLQILRVGELAFAAWPGEIFAVSGLRLKERCPTQPLVNVGQANGWFGYIPPPEQFAYGAYETWPMRTSPLETNATVKMTDEFLRLLAETQPR